jgi:hypothetical protein
MARTSSVTVLRASDAARPAPLRAAPRRASVAVGRRLGTAGLAESPAPGRSPGHAAGGGSDDGDSDRRRRRRWP